MFYVNLFQHIFIQNHRILYHLLKRKYRGSAMVFIFLIQLVFLHIQSLKNNYFFNDLFSYFLSIPVIVPIAAA